MGQRKKVQPINVDSDIIQREFQLTCYCHVDSQPTRIEYDIEFTCNKTRYILDSTRHYFAIKHASNRSPNRVSLETFSLQCSVGDTIDHHNLYVPTSWSIEHVKYLTLIEINNNKVTCLTEVERKYPDRIDRMVDIAIEQFILLFHYDFVYAKAKSYNSVIQDHILKTLQYKPLK